jgi:putative RNA 2'-phosphotransferase
MPAIPPTYLYHGTPPSTANIILREGLKPMKRQYVHLSVDVATAQLVGGRRSQTPAILRVAAQSAHQAGILFYPSQDETWLADKVPAFYISVFEPHNSES